MPGNRNPRKWTEKQTRFMWWAHSDVARKHFEELAKLKAKKRRKKAR